MDPISMIGIGLAIGGTLYENFSAAETERKNEAFYRRQAEFNRAAGARQADIAKRNYSYLKGQQTGVAASQGVAISGSITNIIAGTLMREVEELQAIKLQTDLEVDMARLKAGQAGDKSRTYSDPFFNILTAGTSALRAI